MRSENRLSDDIADVILSMITIEKKFQPGDKLPNENEFSVMLDVSRTTLREAVRSLITRGYLEIRRGLGTFVCDPLPDQKLEGMDALKEVRATIKDLYEMRLIMEPEAAYYATLRGTDTEVTRIAELGRSIAEKIRAGQDRTEQEHMFHQSIAKATHNAFMNQVIPVIQEAISKGVAMGQHNEVLMSDTVHDHQMITDFMNSRNAEGARQAMKIHILHAMQNMGLAEPE